MLELFLLYHLCGRIGDMARTRHRRPFNYQFLLVLLFLGGEFVGILAGHVVYHALNRPPKVDLLCLIGGGVAGATLGATMAFLIAFLTPVKKSLWEMDESDAKYSASDAYECRLLLNRAQHHERRGELAQALLCLEQL